MNRVTQKRMLLSLGTVFFVLGLLELAGRLLIPLDSTRPDGFEADETLGWSLPTGTDMSWRGERVQINTLGLRGPAPASMAATRVLIIGNSSVFGDGVTDIETMSFQLSQLLGAAVDVQNGGVPGYTCWQSRAQLNQLRDRYDPDIVITYNLHSDYRRVSLKDEFISSTWLGFLAPTGVGRLISRGSVWLRAQSDGSNLTLDEYRSCLQGLREDHSGRMVFVVPFSDLDFRSTEPSLIPMKEPSGVLLSDYQEAIREEAEVSSSLLVDGFEAVEFAGLSADAALLDEIHPSAAGHQAIAEAVAGALEDAGWVP